MPTLELVPPREWPTLGRSVLSWMEFYLCHGPGDVQEQPLEFNDTHFQNVLDWYRLNPAESPRAGRRVVSYAVDSEPKGCAKSELAGALICAEFVGPVRFDHWAVKGEVSSWGYHYAEGEPVGKTVTYPFIRPLATEEGQTGNTYGNVVVMLEHAIEHSKRAGWRDWRFSELDVGTTRTFLGGKGKNGEIRPSTSGSASKDGGKETFGVADEIHLYDLPNLISMHAMVRRNCVKRVEAQPWMLATTTMFESGAGSVAESIYDEAAEITEHPGTRRGHSFCFFHRAGFPVDDPTDDAAILASLEESYGPASITQGGHIDPTMVLEGEIRAPGSKWYENVRYFLNLKHKGESKAIDPDLWDSRAAPERTPGPSKQCAILTAFDGSQGGARADDTVLIGWTVEHVPHLFLVRRWRRPDHAGHEYRVSRSAVRKVVTTTRSDFDVRRMVCDPFGWRDEIDGPSEGWVKEHGDAPTGAGGALEPIVREFLTNRPAEMGPAVDRFLEALHEGNFTHDGSLELREYATNALLTEAKGQGNWSALVKPTEDAKIDGLVAAVIGYAELADLPIPAERKVPSIW